MSCPAYRRHRWRRPCHRVPRRARLLSQRASIRAESPGRSARRREMPRRSTTPRPAIRSTPARRRPRQSWKKTLHRVAARQIRSDPKFLRRRRSTGLRLPKRRKPRWTKRTRSTRTLRQASSRWSRGSPTPGPNRKGRSRGRPGRLRREFHPPKVPIWFRLRHSRPCRPKRFRRRRRRGTFGFRPHPTRWRQRPFSRTPWRRRFPEPPLRKRTRMQAHEGRTRRRQPRSSKLKACP